MGYFKRLYTALHSGKTSAARKKKIRRTAATAEKQIREQIRMSFVTDAEFRMWEMDCSERRWSNCTRCPLHRNAERVVFGAGQGDPLVVFVGTAPTEEGELYDRPFAGPERALLRRVASGVGLDLDEHAYLTTAVGCRPIRDRRPDKDERRACVPRLIEILDTLQPGLLVLLGLTAAKFAGIRVVDDDTRGAVGRAYWPDLVGATRAKLRGIVVTYGPRDVLAASTRKKKQRILEAFVDDMKTVAGVVEVLEKKRRGGRW